MKKVGLLIVVMLFLLGITACSKDVTTTDNNTATTESSATTGVTEPLDQDSLLDSISNAIKAAFE